MRRSVLMTAAAAVLSTGCGWYPLPYSGGPYTASSGCIRVSSEFPVNQAALDQDVRAARKTLAQYNIVDEAHFCKEFQSVPITIVSSVVFNEKRSGYYSRLRGIKLTRTGKSLVHEFLHEVDFTRDLVMCSTEHCFWKQKEYFLISNVYRCRSADLKTGAPYMARYSALMTEEDCASLPN